MYILNDLVARQKIEGTKSKIEEELEERIVFYENVGFPVGRTSREKLKIKVIKNSFGYTIIEA